MNSTDNSLFDLEATYTLTFISQLLRVTRKKAYHYVDEKGCLTPKGKQVLDQLNKLYKDNKIHSP
jgi:phage portal protein BeeE